MRLARVTLIIPRQAWATMLLPSGEAAFISNMYIEPRARRLGYCSDFVRAFVNQTRAFPELDILRSSVGGQRCAVNLGYRRIGPSQRYYGCDLWRLPRGRRRFKRGTLEIARVVTYKTARNTKTKVLYLMSR